MSILDPTTHRMTVLGLIGLAAVMAVCLTVLLSLNVNTDGVGTAVTVIIGLISTAIVVHSAAASGAAIAGQNAASATTAVTNAVSSAVEAAQATPAASPAHE